MDPRYNPSVALVTESYRLGVEGTSEELKKFYDEWYREGSYDGVLEGLGYQGPKNVATTFAELVSDKKSTILDIGAGTGLVGEQLKKHGFTNITAVDPSGESIRICREKGCYSNFTEAFVGQGSLPYKDNSIDEAISCGSFGIGYCGGDSLREIIRVLKIGGHLVIGARSTIYNDQHANYNLRQVSDELVNGKICQLERKEMQYSGHSEGIMLTYTKL